MKTFILILCGAFFAGYLLGDLSGFLDGLAVASEVYRGE